ncbi:hypothetical protein AO373_1211 [Moraxella catarrhalis]|nr:hypothetical protein [Moraxella catarrhalis]OAV03956.1 hypothetical protein AO381_0976 [Moraxella catarrhalis]OAV05382.1 hypothetical protein AO379_1769 [Moraxella catarrhalis]OAV17974.1 hypothetical protein AO373_1211 [Moraxella catarrhalis]
MQLLFCFNFFSHSDLLLVNMPQNILPDGQDYEQSLYRHVAVSISNHNKQ